MEASGINAGDIRTDYMKLLIAELRNQNPLEPMDNYQMASQLTQLGQLEQLQGMGGSFEKVLAATQQGQAAALIGKQVSFYPPDGSAAVTGQVEGVDIVGGQVQLRVGNPLQYTSGGQAVTKGTHLDRLDQASGLSFGDTITVYGAPPGGQQLNGGSGVQIGLHDGWDFLTVGELLEAITDTFRVNGQETYVAELDDGRVRLVDKYTGQQAEDVRLTYQGGGRLNLPAFRCLRIGLDSVAAITE